MPLQQAVTSWLMLRFHAGFEEQQCPGYGQPALSGGSAGLAATCHGCYTAHGAHAGTVGRHHLSKSLSGLTFPFRILCLALYVFPPRHRSWVKSEWQMCATSGLALQDPNLGKMFSQGAYMEGPMGVAPPSQAEMPHASTGPAAGLQAGRLCCCIGQGLFKLLAGHSSKQEAPHDTVVHAPAIRPYGLAPFLQCAADQAIGESHQ